MITRRSLRLGLVASSLIALAGACGEPFVFSGTGGGTSSSSSSSSSGNTGGSGGASSSSSSGTMSSSSGTMSSSSSSGSSGSSTSSSGGCSTADADNDGKSECDGDCNDNDASIFPGHAEICGDAKDNDCNGTTDDNCGGLGTFVANAGDDNNPGTMAQPVRTIGKGIEHAKTINAGGGDGSRVFVSAGHYPEDVVVVEGISLYGGYNPATWVQDPANPANDTAILSQGPDGVWVDDTVTRATVIDGFRLQGASGMSTGGTGNHGAAITIDGGSPTVTRNTINGPNEGDLVRSIGLLVLGPSNDPQGALIQDNRISGGSGTGSPLVPCEGSFGVLLTSTTFPPPSPGTAADIVHNQIRSGSCKFSRAVVSWTNAAGTRLYDNDIDTGTATSADAFGIVVGGSPLGALMIIDKNRINLNQGIIGGCSLLSTATSSWCGGIDSQAAKLSITNNVIFGVKGGKSTAVWLRNPEIAPQEVVLHSNYLDGGGVFSAAGSTSAALVVTLNVGTNGTVGRIRNNIFAGGSGVVTYGVFEDSLPGKQCHPDKLENNDFFLNISGGNAYYRAWDGAAALKVTDINMVNMNGYMANFAGDPLVDTSFHIVSNGSPCVNTGTSVEAPAKDFDGEGRPKGSGFDVGPDEK